MRSFILFILLWLVTLAVTGQTTPASTSSFELGNGLNFRLNEGAYAFRISGMVQSYLAFEKMGPTKAQYYFNARNAYFNFSGNAIKEKVSFFF
ncbi:MAG: hypothetical protein IH599_05460 [Bacteroidales bacterium]|nr:hypothetical protein [Bacteroidales bacterium]